jgi:hypothetical protein
MGTDVSVVIAYRDMGCEYRRASFHYVKAWYEAAGFEVVVESGSSDASFTRASAINTAIGRASGRVIVQSDPDSLVPLTTLRHAIDLAAMPYSPMVIPHSEYLYASPDWTSSILSGEAEIWDTAECDCETYGYGGSGNVVVFTRALWELADRFDERFGLWGGDDAAFRYVCEALRGPAERLVGPMVHLWHPRLPQSEPGHPKYIEQFALLAQYRDAAAIGPHAVLRLNESR